MIIENQEQVTEAVLGELPRVKDPRLGKVLSAAVRHLHEFAREVNLSEAEFRRGCAILAQAGQMTTKSHNEIVLLAGTMGISSLVCLLNNGRDRDETTANLLGPFWREPAPDPEVTGPWYSLDFTFTMEPGDDALPLAPISGRTEGEERPEQVVWERP